MPRNVVVLLSTTEGRALLRQKCREAGLSVETLEALIEAELEQIGKQRKHGRTDAFDEILSQDLIAREGER